MEHSNKYLVEMEEWTRVNRQLRQHGLPQVELLHPAQAADTSDVVMLEPEMTQTLRQTLFTLMKDCDRRQELVQELILTNNQLSSLKNEDEKTRRELGEQTSSTERYESKARELKAQLDTSRSHIEDLEEDRLLHGVTSPSEEEEKLRNTKNVIHQRCQQLQRQVDEQVMTIEQLEGEIRRRKEEEKRLKEKHEAAYSRLKKQLPRNAHIDDKTLDLIDLYERQLFTLRKRVDDHDNKNSQNSESSFDEATPNYKSLIKSYERELREAKKKLKRVENENEVLVLDLQGRPDIKDYRAMLHKMKKLERTVKKHNLNPSVVSEGKNDRAYSSRVEDLDYLPADQCRTHLTQVCHVLKLDDLDDLQTTVYQHKRVAEAQPRLIQFAREVLDVVNTPGLPVPADLTNRSDPRSLHEVWCEKTWHHVLPTLHYWRNQMAGLKDLQESLVRLSAMFLPTPSVDLLSHQPSTVNMVTAVQAFMSEEPSKHSQTGAAGRQDRPSQDRTSQDRTSQDRTSQDRTSQDRTSQDRTSLDRPSRSVLQGIVDHFMTLFDVRRVSGVYARMNDLYTKLGEVHNMMKTLRNLLGLSGESRGSAVVEAVGRLCRTQNEARTDDLKRLLHVDDLDTVTRKLEEHEQFFPAFQNIMSQLMETCNCQRLDQVVPTVQALKMLAG